MGTALAGGRSDQGFRRRLRRYRRDHELGLSRTWFIFDQATGALYGGLTLSGIKLGAARNAQLGYWMGEPHAGKGIMKRAATLLLAEAFSAMSLERIEAACLTENERSSRLLTSLGFQREGIVRSYLEIDGERRDHVLFALLKSDIAKTLAGRRDALRPKTVPNAGMQGGELTAGRAAD